MTEEQEGEIGDWFGIWNNQSTVAMAVTVPAPVARTTAGSDCCSSQRMVSASAGLRGGKEIDGRGLQCQGGACGGCPGLHQPERLLLREPLFHFTVHLRDALPAKMLNCSGRSS